MTPEALRTLADQCIQWYWAHGHQRADQYEISRGSCLDALYSVRDRALAIERGGLTPRPCMALWGPSQTGKSTLLSGYLDVEGDQIGTQSALTWSEAEPVRFGGELKSDGSNVVINPYNGGADGSGCISRFVMLDSVPDSAFPVEITLATESQILHALAAGYESECQAKSKTGELDLAWKPESFRALIEGVRSAGPPDADGFEALHRLADVVDLLIAAGNRRYANLGETWGRTLRPLMLNNPHLANRSALREFVGELLWDCWPAMNSLRDRLQAKQTQLQKLWSVATTLRCSWKVAALLLDISAYGHYQRTERPQVRQLVDLLSYRVGGDGTVSIGTGLERPLMQSGEDFGLFQGLIWELRLPLRRDVLKTRAPHVAAFLDKADLMDFPGVSNEHEGASKITNDILAADLCKGLTEVLKRGKTASIAVSRSNSLDIDGFSILAKVGAPPGQPRQLVSGIQCWMRAFGQKWPPQGRTMPLNLVLTFCARMVNDVCQSGIRNGLEPYFSLFNKLDHLADPRVVTMFTTTYPWLPTVGRILFPEDKVREKVAEILTDRSFLDRFGDNHQSFEHMVADGGTDYLIQCLREQAETSRRPALLEKRLREAEQRLVELMSPHLPSKDAAQDERNRALDAWREGIETLLKAPNASEHEFDPAANVSRHLRRFLNIDPDELEPLPLNAIARKAPLKKYVENQFRIWRSSRAAITTVTELGLRDGAHAQRVLAALVEAVSLDEVLKFVRDNLGTLGGRREAQDCRRFVAVKMGRELLRTLEQDAPHSSDEAINERLEQLRELAQAEDEQSCAPETSPHYLSVIKPLLNRVEHIKSLAAGNRPPQAGDSELSRLLRQNGAVI